MSNNANNTNNAPAKKKVMTTDRILILIIAIPIIAAILIGGGAAIWQGIVAIAKPLFPNVWVAVGYLYIGVLGFFIGRKTKKK